MDTTPVQTDLATSKSGPNYEGPILLLSRSLPAAISIRGFTRDNGKLLDGL